MSNLASTFWYQGQWNEAEQLQLKVIETSKTTSRTVLGLEHPDTLASMHNLVGNYYDQGRIQEAQKLVPSCVEAQTRQLGARHPNTQGS
ncbi:hypothetical protein K431DRAFT_201231, partial [Polychaeton citri CBS 116435]